MRTKADIEAAFTYHPPTDAEVVLMGQLREKFRDLALFIYENVPESADRTVVFRKLHEASMQTNASIVLNRSTAAAPSGR